MLFQFAVAVLTAFVVPQSFATVEIKDNLLYVDGARQPFLYGAELQYFRLRGGNGPNIPREQVRRTWMRALSAMRSAGMNAISFYIPWDFHEYEEGKFDFTGSVDQDRDGNADYPSRDVVGFIEMAKSYGFNRIMVRPGPYINAEWGFLGFGAIPLWFHQKYPNSHMRNSKGLRTKLYDYHNEDLLRHTKLWFSAVYENVLKKHIGRDRSILFVQLDNETNFMWQSLYNHDYSPKAVLRYQEFLKQKYLTIQNLNFEHGSHWKSFVDIFPATEEQGTTKERQDWFKFQDDSIFQYLVKIRRTWEEVGVHEPDVLFTLAESYNSTKDGLLPNFQLRNVAGQTGMMTMNMYPKTYESGALLNLPFKIDHDTIAMTEAVQNYLHSPEQWLMGPEIQGGWWRGTNVSDASRKQTYLSAIGHGLKALFIYYFSEGQNWQSNWAREQITPFYEELKNTPEFASLPISDLPKIFWKSLQDTVDKKLLVGFDVKHVLMADPATEATLYFDAPLDEKARPGKHYDLISKIGNKIIAPYREFLAESLSLTDSIGIVKDVNQHLPSGREEFPTHLTQANASGALLGWLMSAGYSPKIYHWGISNLESMKNTSALFYLDTEVLSQELLEFFADYVQSGGTLVTLLGSKVNQYITDQGRGHLYTYSDGRFQNINSDAWADLLGMPELNLKLREWLPTTLATPVVTAVSNDGKAVAFARYSPKRPGLWITMKTGSTNPTVARLTLNRSALQKGRIFSDSVTLKNPMNGETRVVQIEELTSGGVKINLESSGSDVLFVR